MHNEKVFTPSWLVERILDHVGYEPGKTIMDNSCGEGAFLTAALRRIVGYMLDSGLSGIVDTATSAIHGIEKDPELALKTVENLNAVMDEYGLSHVKWDVVCGDAMDAVECYGEKFDFVVGNPPYANVHDLDAETLDKMRRSPLCQGGMTDLYLVFFELGYRMLKDGGTLIYITPSGWTNSVAGRGFREFLFDTDCLWDFIHMRHTQVFGNAQVYTAITTLRKPISNNPNVEPDVKRVVSIREFNADTREFGDRITIGTLYSLRLPNGAFCFEDMKVRTMVADVMNYDGPRYVKVQNGFATLNDKLFVVEWEENEELLDTCESEATRMAFPDAGNRDFIPVVKASTGEEKYIMFPYAVDFGTKPPKTVLRKLESLQKNTVEHLKDRLKELGKEEILNKPSWWGYGRTQAINDTLYGVKSGRVSLNNLIRGIEDIKLVSLDHLNRMWGVYGGFYVVGDGVTKELVWSILATDEFVAYVKALGHYKSGGYYTFTSKEVEKFINTVIERRMENDV